MSHRHLPDRTTLGHPSHGGAPGIPVDLGTGVLAVMRINSDIEAIKPRLPLREPLPKNHHYKQGDARMRVILNACHGHRTPHSDSDFSFDVPVDIDMEEDVTPVFRMSQVTDEEAQLHGYAKASDMRKSLGFRKGEDGYVQSYRLLSPLIPPNDLALAGERARVTRGAYEALRGAKGDHIIYNRRTGSIRESSEDSIKRARSFLKTLPREAALIAEASITPVQHLEPVELVPFAAPPMHTRASKRTNDRRLVPAAVQALRVLGDEPVVAAPRKPRRAKVAQTTTESETNDESVIYATDFGSRGQYMDERQRPQIQPVPKLSREERRTVVALKKGKEEWRNRVARASFGVGEDLPAEPAAFARPKSFVHGPRISPVALREERLSHLAEEGVPLEGPFDTEAYLRIPRGDGRGR